MSTKPNFLGSVEQHPTEAITYTIDTVNNGAGVPSGVALRAYDKSDWSPVTPSTFTSAVSTTVIAVQVGGLSDNTTYRIEVEYTKGADTDTDLFDIICEDHRNNT